MTTATPMRCPASRNAANPMPAAPRRSQSGASASVPVGKTMSLAVTAMTSAVATARTQCSASESSSSRFPANTPSQRQISVASQPATAITTKGHHSLPMLLLHLHAAFSSPDPETVDEIGERPAADARIEHVEPR